MSNPPSPALPRRLAALLYDSLLVLPLIMFSTALAMGANMLMGGSSAPIGEPMLDPRLVQVLALLTSTVFYTSFWLIKGQTLGMQAWRIRLRSYRGARVTPGQALLRCLGAVLSLLPAGAGYWWCLFDRNRRYWHDYLSGTELELLPKR